MTNRSRWSPDEKIRIVLESLNTNISMAELCRKYNVTPVTFYAWKEKFVQGGKLALSGQLKDPAKEKQAENDRLKKLKMAGLHAEWSDSSKAPRSTKSCQSSGAGFQQPTSRSSKRRYSS